MLAAQSSHLAVIEQLLNKGAEATLLSKFQGTIYIMLPNKEMNAWWLIAPQLINVQNTWGQTALMFTVEAGHLSMIQSLVPHTH